MDGRDNDGPERDEDPSDEDIRRFSRPHAAHCQECGQAVHEDADICPRCHAFVFPPEPGHGRSGRHRAARRAFLWALVLILLALSGVAALLLRR